MTFEKGCQSFLKGKTYEEIFGEERAKEIKRKIGLGKGMLGKHHKPETIAKMKIAQLGKKNYAYGTHHTKEWKKIMRLKIKET